MLDIKVGDMVMIPGRFWRVKGLHIRGDARESVVELQIVDRESAHIGNTVVSKLLVPEDLLTQKMIYRSTVTIAEESEKPTPNEIARNAEITATERSIPRPVDKAY